MMAKPNVHAHSGVPLSLRMEILTQAGVWTNLEDTVLNKPVTRRTV